MTAMSVGKPTWGLVLLTGWLTIAGSSPRSEQDATPADSDLIWIEGRVVVPEDLPDGEPVAVVSHGAPLEDGRRPRAVVGADGSFRIGVPAQGLRARLDVEADHLHLPRPAWIHLRRPAGPVELRPVLAGRIVLELEAQDSEHRELLRTSSIVLVPQEPSVTTRAFLGALEQATPDADLRAVFRGVPAGPAYVLGIVPRNGFPDELTRVRVRPGWTVRRAVAVPRGTRISGRVVDEDGAPMHGVEVHLCSSRTTPEMSEARTRRLRTDEEGRFEVTAVPAGELEVWADVEGYGMAHLDLGEPPHGTQVRAEPLVLRRGKRVTVEVVRGDGRPVVGAEVRLEGPGMPDPDDPFDDGRRDLDEQSVYTYGGLGRGPFTVTAITYREEPPAGGSGGDEARPSSFGRLEDVEPGSTVQVVVPEPARIEGRVVDAAGAPIAAYRLDVEPEPPNDFWDCLTEELDDPSGAFALTLPPGRWTVSVSGGGFGSRTLALSPEAPVELPVARAVTCTGVVRDAAGRPVAGAEVSARHTRLRRGGRATRSTSVETASDGSWRLEVPAGWISIGAAAGELETRERVRRQADPGEELTVELRIE